MNFGVCDFPRLAVTDWRLRRWRLWFLALSNAPHYRYPVPRFVLRQKLLQNSRKCNLWNPVSLNKIEFPSSLSGLVCFDRLNINLWGKYQIPCDARFWPHCYQLTRAMYQISYPRLVTRPWGRRVFPALFQTRDFLFQILRSHVMVRVGGGWDTLAHYLDKHDPCRCRSGKCHRCQILVNFTILGVNMCFYGFRRRRSELEGRTWILEAVGCGRAFLWRCNHEDLVPITSRMRVLTYPYIVVKIIRSS